MSIPEALIGDTVRLTMVDSGVTHVSPSYTILDQSETAVSTGTMTDSGDGHLYADVTLPNTPSYYVAEMRTTIAGNPYKRRRKVRAVRETV